MKLKTVRSWCNLHKVVPVTGLLQCTCYMEQPKLFSMDELLDLTYLSMMYGRRSKFSLKDAKNAHKKWAESIFKSKTDNVPNIKLK